MDGKDGVQGLFSLSPATLEELEQKGFPSHDETQALFDELKEKGFAEQAELYYLSEPEADDE
jgi:hypothetical protein